MASGAALEKLHQLHLSLQEVQDDLDRGPRLIAAKSQLVERKLAELKTKQDLLKQLKVASDQKSLQQKTNSAKIVDLRVKMNASSAQREYDILKNQIAADEMANSVLDDEILETLDRIEAGQKEIVDVEATVAAARAELDKVTAMAKAKEPDLQARKAALVAEVGAAEKFLPGEIVPTYRRLVQAHGASALSPVRSKSCSECFLGLTSQMFLELRSGKVLFCSTCGRLLYVPLGE